MREGNRKKEAFIFLCKNKKIEKKDKYLKSMVHNRLTSLFF